MPEHEFVGHGCTAAFGVSAWHERVPELYITQIDQPAGDPKDLAAKFLRRLYSFGVDRTAGYLDDHQYGRFLWLYVVEKCEPARRYNDYL